jgi:hypothetical protein
MAMRYNTVALIAAGIAGVFGMIALLPSLNPATQAQVESAQHVVMQVDLPKTFNKFGQPGFFKLLADFTDMHAVHGHVAVSNVACKADGSSPFVVVVANAEVGAGNTKLAIIPLNSGNLVNDVSAMGQACTYHVDIHGADYEFPITDIAVANSDADAIHGTLQTSSATIHAEIVG